MDYYKILNIEKTASQDEVKKAYRKLSMIHHPDRQGGNEEKFKEINKAYEVLSDPEERKKYDSPFNGGGHNGTNINLNSDIFKMFFKGMPGMPQNMNFNNENISGFNVFSNGANFMMKPTPIVKTIKISLSQAYTGINYPIEIERWIQNQDNTKYTEKEKVYVSIPPGIDENEIIIMKEKGNVIQDKYRGDLKCFIKIENDTKFKRNGLNLIYTKEISLKEALCGFSFTFEFIDGKKYTINNNNGKIINPEFKKQIPNMGMKRNASSGSLIIEFKVIFPTTLSNDAIKKLEAIL